MRKQDAIQADEGEHFSHVGADAGDDEAVARTLGGAVKCDEGGNAGGVHTVNVSEVKHNALLPHERRKALDKGELLSPNQLIEVVGGDAQGSGGIESGVHLEPPWGAGRARCLFNVHPARQTGVERNRLNPEEIATDCPCGAALPGVQIRERRSQSNTMVRNTQKAGGEVPEKVEGRWKSSNRRAG